MDAARRWFGPIAAVCLLMITGCSRGQAGTPSAGGELPTSTASETGSSSVIGRATGTATASATASSPQARASVGGSGDVLSISTVQDVVLRPMQSETDDFWEETFRLAKLSDSVSAAMDFVSTGDSITCGRETLVPADDVGPVYCPEEDHILLTDAFVGGLAASRTIRADGSFVSPADEVGLYFLIAHEWGHNIIAELAQDKDLELTAVSELEIENLADCFAGMAIAGVPRVFTDKDPNSMLALAESRDEPLGGQRGTADQRRDAITTGLDNTYEDRQGFADSLDRCVTTYAPTIGAMK